MSWALADLLVTTTRDTFGAAATFTPSGGSSESCTAVVDEAHRVPAVDADGNPIWATQVRIALRVSDLSRRPKIEDRITSAGVTYVVTGVETGGDGDVYCVVQRVGG